MSSHIFPLPYIPLPFLSSSTSRRCIQRAYRSRSLVLLVNATIGALNYLFNKTSFFKNSQHYTSYYHTNNNTNNINSNSSSSLPTIPQKRVLDHLFNYCKSFYNTISDTPSSSNSHHHDCRRNYFTSDSSTIQRLSFSFLSSFKSFFAPYPSSPLHSSSNVYFDDSVFYTQKFISNLDDNIVPSFLSYSKASITAIPLVSHKVALPSSLHSLPMLSLLPTHLQAYYNNNSNMLFQQPSSSTATKQIKIKSPHVFSSQHEYILLIKRMKSVGMINFTTAPKCVNGCFGVPKPDGEIRLVIDAQNANACFSVPPHVDLPNPSHISNINTSTLNSSFYVSKCDLSNFYHHISLPDFMQPYFALPPIKASIIDDNDNDDTYIYPMCTTIPMGWSHAVYVAQHIHLHVLYSSKVLSQHDNILCTNDFFLNRSLHFVYIDDLSILSPSYEQATTLHTLVLKAYDEAGFIVKASKVVAPTSQPVEVLGVEICGEHHTLKVSITKLLALQKATSVLISNGSCSGHTLSKVVGSWIWPCLIRRSSLSIFRQIYRFIAISNLRVFQLWPSVIRELCLVSFLAPLLQVSLAANDFKYLLATDASEAGGALVYSKLFNHQTSFLNVVAPVLTYVPPHVQPTLSSTHVAQHREACDVVSAYTWTTIASYPWKFSSHINLLEMNALLTGIRWASTYPSSFHTRIHALTDSSSVLYSTQKGRSSSKLSSSLQRLAAHIFAFNIILKTYWIPSRYNPADAPSRFL